MISVHLIISFFPPDRGGMEAWSRDLATALCGRGFRPIVYVCEGDHSIRGAGEHPFEVVELGPMRARWAAPLHASVISHYLLGLERARLSFLCAKAEVSKRLGAGPDVLLSTYLTSAGWTAHLVSESLGIPHVPVAVGTDLNRNFTSPAERFGILETCRQSPLVVCKSAEQARTLRGRLPDTALEVIATSVDIPTQRWHKPQGDTLTVFSDGGFDHKKGTGVLMDSFLGLHAEDARVKLEICGADRTGQEGYWNARRTALAEAPAMACSFPGYLSVPEILEKLRTCDIYASATLGEGSSSARARALCMGVPMVTTACGELAEAPRAGHLRLVAPADAAAFEDALIRLAADLRAGRVTIDEEAVADFRDRFDREREWERWSAVLHRAAASKPPT